MQKAVLSLSFSVPLIYDRNQGFRTAELSLPFSLLQGFNKGERQLERTAGKGLQDSLMEGENSSGGGISAPALAGCSGLVETAGIEPASASTQP